MRSPPRFSDHAFRPPSFWREHQWVILGCSWVAVFLLGLGGAWRYYQGAAAGWERFFDALYLDLQLFTLSANFPFEGPSLGWPLQVARLLAPAIAALTLLETLKLVFEERWQQWRVRGARGHVIVCGLGRKGLTLALRLRQRGERVVVVERDESHPSREPCRERGIVVLTGDATAPESLDRAGLEGAKTLVGLCGDDGANLELAMRARERVAYRSAATLSCLIHVEDPRLCHLVQEAALRLTREGVMRLDLFNVYDRAALALLDDSRPFAEAAGGAAPRLLVVGSGSLSRSFVRHAAELWGERPEAADRKLRLTWVDEGAARDAELLKRRHPDLEERCELEALALDLRSGAFLDGAFLDGALLDGGAGFTRVFVLLDDEDLALVTALELHRMLSGRRPAPKIAVSYQGSLLDSLKRDEPGVEALAALEPFSTLDRAMQPELLFTTVHERLARAIHESFRRQRMLEGQGDHPAAVTWEELPEALKESNRQQASHLEAKIRQLERRIVPRVDWDQPLGRLTPPEVEALAEDEHRRFVEERLAAGWRYGPERDYERKTNPTLVSWEELSESEREKDREAVRQIPALLAKVGLELS